MSILDAAPKTSVRLLVGRESELRDVVRSVLEHRITVVLGPRRIGKTSIVRTALAVLSGREMLEGVDVGRRFVPIYVDMWSVVATKRSPETFFQHLHHSIARALTEYDAGLAREYLERMSLVEEVSAKEGGVSLVVRGRVGRLRRYRRSQEAERCLDELNDLLAKRGERAVLAIDEAQELSSLKPFSPSVWLAHIHDDLTSIHVLLSGSYVGLLKKVLHPRSRDPLYGRDINRVSVGKLSPRHLVEILLRGLEERGVKPSSEFVEVLSSVVDLVTSADLAQYMPLYSVALDESRSRVEQLLKSVEELETRVRELLSRRGSSGLELVMSAFTALMYRALIRPLLCALIVYYAASLLLGTGFDHSAFASTLPEEEAERVKPIIDLFARPGSRALAVLSLMALSGSPSLVISLAKKLPQNFTEEDLVDAGLHVLEEGYRAVCDEVNRFIESYSKKPEIIATILYDLYTSPRTWSHIVQTLTSIGVDRKSVRENLRTLMELGYVAKFRAGINAYYYIADPLLLYALREECVRYP